MGAPHCSFCDMTLFYPKNSIPVEPSHSISVPSKRCQHMPKTWNTKNGVPTVLPKHFSIFFMVELLKHMISMTFMDYWYYPYTIHILLWLLHSKNFGELMKKPVKSSWNHQEVTHVCWPCCRPMRNCSRGFQRRCPEPSGCDRGRWKIPRVIFNQFFGRRRSWGDHGDIIIYGDFNGDLVVIYGNL